MNLEVCIKRKEEDLEEHLFVMYLNVYVLFYTSTFICLLFTSTYVWFYRCIEEILYIYVRKYDSLGILKDIELFYTSTYVWLYSWIERDLLRLYSSTYVRLYSRIERDTCMYVWVYSWIERDLLRFYTSTYVWLYSQIERDLLRVFFYQVPLRTIITFDWGLLWSDKADSKITFCFPPSHPTWVFSFRLVFVIAKLGSSSIVLWETKLEFEV